MLAEASDLLGLPIVVTDTPYGSIDIDIHNTDGHTLGRARRVNGCERVVWSDDRPGAIAHELGHALGLGHHPDKGNLMYEYIGGSDLTEDQIDQMIRSSAALRACHPSQQRRPVYVESPCMECSPDCP